MKKILLKNLSAIFALFFLLTTLLPLSAAEESILIEFEKLGLWKIDRPNHRCFVSARVWAKIPYEQKEKMLYAVYSQEKTWWEFYDSYSGKLLAKVSSWGLTVNP